MAVVKELDLEQFIQLFKNMDRDYYSLEGYEIMYNFLHDLSKDINEDIKADVVGFCTDFSEYNSLLEYNEDYHTSYRHWEEVEGFLGNVGEKGALVYSY